MFYVDREGCVGRRRRPKRRQMRRFGQWYIFFCFDTNLFFNVYICCIYVVYAPGGLRWAATIHEGPNDARSVVWAIGTYIYI